MAGHWGTHWLLLTVLASGCTSTAPGSSTQYGVYIGPLTFLHTTVIGEVYVVSEYTLFIRKFVYDGTGRDTYFWIGSESDSPSPQGVPLFYPDDGGVSKAPLTHYSGVDILLRLPASMTTRQIKWLSIWCRRFTVDFGHVIFPRYIDPPRARELGPFKRLSHKVQSGRVRILDVRTFYIPNLHYDGQGSDAYFWIGNGSEPNPSGMKIPDQTGSYDNLRAYMGQDIEVTLPEGVTVYNIQWLAIWSVRYRHSFGWIPVPDDLANIPPFIRQTRSEVPLIWTQFDKMDDVGNTEFVSVQSATDLELPNCRSFVGGQLRVRWNSDQHYVYVQLAARLRPNEWMGFGLSRQRYRTEMEGGDAVIVFHDDEEGVFRAEDYFLGGKSQCSEGRGVCLDHVLGGTDDAVVLDGQQLDGVTSVTYKRLLDTGDFSTDLRYETEREVNVIASIGLLRGRNEVNYHSRGWDSGLIDFSAKSVDMCSTQLEISDVSDSTESATVAAPHVNIVYDWQHWNTRYIINSEKLHFRLGPSGGSRRYPVSHQSSDLSHGQTTLPSLVWWVNNELMPELYVYRGRTYEFLVEAGNDPSNPSEYHPLYITDSSEGGYAAKNHTDRASERVFAGVRFNSIGGPTPIAAGRLCRYQPKVADASTTASSFEEFRDSLQLQCKPGVAATLTWQVAQDTPSLVFYQCYTHKNLGWKIHVLNNGEIPDVSGAAGRHWNCALLILPLIVYWTVSTRRSPLFSRQS